MKTEFLLAVRRNATVKVASSTCGETEIALWAVNSSGQHFAQLTRSLGGVVVSTERFRVDVSTGNTKAIAAFVGASAAMYI